MLRSISKILDGIYRIGAVVSGALLILLCCLVLYSISSRMFGFYAGGATDVAGYVMATSTFMALAYTFRTQGHIRVALLIQNLQGSRRGMVEILGLGVMSIVMTFLAFYMYRLVYDSWDFGERSEGADAILMWIPQLPVAVGAFLLAVSVVHTLIQAVFDYDAVNPETSEHEGPNEV
ncbi:TRAP transporter small permease [Sulfitobacter sp. SK012]|uniref:TRAP transporter small permease n=1 Tax=Sulfitobacter sp. SK012 TaxID=1389005 RepID=UPI0013B35804|nr:TRAP transporter small permease [Sulfitobacter sp. SK012]